MNLFNVLRFFRSAKWLVGVLLLVFVALGSSETVRAALTCGTTYYYRARSTDSSSNTTTSSEKSFTTSACDTGGSGGTSGSGNGSTGSTTTTTTTTSTAAPATTSTTTNTTTAKTTTTTTTQKTTTTTASKTTTATPAPGEATAAPSETTTIQTTATTAPTTLSLAAPQTTEQYRTFYGAVVSKLDFCRGGQTSGCIDLPPPPPPPSPPPPCQDDGTFGLKSNNLRGPEIFATLVLRVIPIADIPCGGSTQEQFGESTEDEYCAGYKASSGITKLFVANPCVEVDQITDDEYDCYAQLAQNRPCILGEVTETPSPDGTGTEVLTDEGGGELICPPPSEPVGGACVAQDPDIQTELDKEEIVVEDTCVPTPKGASSIFNKLQILAVAATDSCTIGIELEDIQDDPLPCPPGWVLEGGECKPGEGIDQKEFCGPNSILPGEIVIETKGRACIQNPCEPPLILVTKPRLSCKLPDSGGDGDGGGGLCEPGFNLFFVDPVRREGPQWIPESQGGDQTGGPIDTAGDTGGPGGPTDGGGDTGGPGDSGGGTGECPGGQTENSVGICTSDSGESCVLPSAPFITKLLQFNTDECTIGIVTDEGGGPGGGGGGGDDYGCPTGLSYNAVSERCEKIDDGNGDCATGEELKLGSNISQDDAEKIGEWLGRFFKPCDQGDGGGGGDSCPTGFVRALNGLCESTDGGGGDGDDDSGPDCYTKETLQAYGGLGSMVAKLNRWPAPCAEDDGGPGDDGFDCGGFIAATQEDCEGPPPPRCPDGSFVTNYPNDCPQPDCRFLQAGAPRLFPQLSIISPTHKHQGDPELRIKLGEEVTVASEGQVSRYTSYYRSVENFPQFTLIIPASYNSVDHASITTDSLIDLVQSPELITDPVRVTYVGITDDYLRTGGLACYEASQSQSKISLIVDPNDDLQLFQASPVDITSGELSVLSWSVVGQTSSVELDGQRVPEAGTKIVQPNQTTTYHLRITPTRPGASQIEKTVTVTVRADQKLCTDGTTWVAANTFPQGCPPPPPDCVSLTTSVIAPKHAHPSADPTVQVTAGEPLTIGSDVSQQGNAPLQFQGYARSSPDQPNLYKVFSYGVGSDPGGHRFLMDDDGADFLAGATKITKPTLVTYQSISSATCPAGSQLTAITVLVVPGAQGAPTASLSADPDTITKGGQSTLTWTTTNATTITLDGTRVNTSGSQVVTPEKTTEYELVAKGPGGEVKRTVTVTVTDTLGDCLKQYPPSPVSLSQIRATPPGSGPHPDPLTVTLSSNASVFSPSRFPLWWLSTDGSDPAIRAQNNFDNPDARGDEIKATLLAPGARVRAHLVVLTACNVMFTRSFDGSFEVKKTEDPAKPTLTAFANPAGGEVTLGQTVVVTLDYTDKAKFPQAELYYTLDGSNPTDASTHGAAGQPVVVAFTIKGERTELTFLAKQGESRSSIEKAVFLATGGPEDLGPPSGTIKVEPAAITQGEAAQLTWNSVNAEKVEVLSDDGSLKRTELAGTVEVKPTKTTLYTLTATNAKGEFKQSVALTVKGQPAPPEISLSASKSELKPGESVDLTWTSKNAKSLELTASTDPGFKQTALSGSVNHSPKATTIYAATATGGGKTITTSVIVTVAPPGEGPGDLGKFDVFFSHSPASADPTKLKDPITVTIAATKPNATIYYTTDPTVSNEDLASRRRVSQYTAPIPVAETTVIRAIGFIDQAASAIASSRYVFTKDDPPPPGLGERLRILITPNPAGQVFTDPTEFTIEVEELEGLFGTKGNKLPPSAFSLHAEPGRKKLSRNSAKIGTKFLVTTAGEWTFKAFGSESPDTTVFFDVRTQPVGAGGPTATANPPSGSYPGPLQVSLAAAGGAGPVSLLYTTDGSSPLGSGGKPYTGTLTINDSTLLYYAAKDAQGKTSGVGAASYTITPATPGTGDSGAGTAPSGGSTLTLSWPSVPPTSPDQPIRYEVTCNGQVVATVNEPIATVPTSGDPCSITVVAKAGDETVATIPAESVTPVVAGAPAKAKARVGPPATPVEQATAVAETSVATTAVAAAAVATVATASAPVAAAASGLLYQLLAHGFGVVAFLGRRRKGPFTEVFDRTTGLPIAGATVTLLEATSNRAVAVVTTDTLGRFTMLIEAAGRYFVRITHPSYATWHSRELTVGQAEQALVMPSITLQAGQPSTGLDRAEARSQLILTGLTKLRFPLLVAGTIILLATNVRAATAGGGLKLTPDRSASIALYVALWASEAWVRTRPRPYGVVVDGATGEPIDRAIVRLLDGQTGRLIKTVVTSAKGRFQFLAPKGSVSLVVVHAGHQPYRQDHLLLSGKDSLVNETVRLQPLTQGAAPITPPAPQSPTPPVPQPPIRPIVPPQLPRRGPPPPNP